MYATLALYVYIYVYDYIHIYVCTYMYLYRDTPLGAPDFFPPASGKDAADGIGVDRLTLDAGRGGLIRSLGC